MSNTFRLGDLVEIQSGPFAGTVGVVSEPVAADGAGHVLFLQEGCVHGAVVANDEVIEAGEGSDGFAQLAYNLIKLGSRVIEQKLIVYRT